jgi:hypothetical protein
VRDEVYQGSVTVTDVGSEGASKRTKGASEDKVESRPLHPLYVLLLWLALRSSTTGPMNLRPATPRADKYGLYPVDWVLSLVFLPVWPVGERPTAPSPPRWRAGWGPALSCTFQGPSGRRPSMPL